MADTTKHTLEILSECPPENLVARVWQELTRATKDRHHSWKTPALASIGLDGNPQVRTIVLRHANPTLWTLESYTDSRSPKYQELVKQGCAQLVFWSARLKWQLRVSVNASVHAEGDFVETAWSRVSQSKASKDYLASQAPGSAVISNNVNEIFSPNAPSNHYLAVLSFQVISMDWLELGKEMHRRARIDPNGIVTQLSP